jgi:multiple sugar transport system substrate-binding protein/sn-glycerol 3-phosphate transport system substrate-binding protein
MVIGAILWCSCARGEAAKTNIEYWHPNAEVQGGLVVTELVRQFNEQSATTHVTERFIPDMYNGIMQVLQAEAAAGKSPAVVQVGWVLLDYFSNNFQYSNPQTVIDKYFPSDSTFIKDNFSPNVIELAINNDGNLVGLPYSISNPVLFLNKDILREAGLSENGPKTWEELKVFAKTIKERTGKYGFYMEEDAGSWAPQALVESTGARFVTYENGSARASFASEDGIKAYELYANMVLEDKSALHSTWEEGLQAFIKGNVGMFYTTIARRANIQKTVTFNVDAINSPAWLGKEDKRAIPAGGCMLAIAARTEDEKKSAWEFMKFLYSVKSIAAWTIGTGYAPPREGVADAEDGLKSFMAENKMMEAATSQMKYVVPWASFPGDAGLQAEQALTDMRDEILGGSKPARQAMLDTQEKINQLLD